MEVEELDSLSKLQSESTSTKGKAGKKPLSRQLLVAKSGTGNTEKTTVAATGNEASSTQSIPLKRFQVGQTEQQSFGFNPNTKLHSQQQQQDRKRYFSISTSKNLPEISQGILKLTAEVGESFEGQDLASQVSPEEAAKRARKGETAPMSIRMKHKTLSKNISKEDNSIFQSQSIFESQIAESRIVQEEYRRDKSDSPEQDERTIREKAESLRPLYLNTLESVIDRFTKPRVLKANPAQELRDMVKKVGRRIVIRSMSKTNKSFSNDSPQEGRAEESSEVNPFHGLKRVVVSRPEIDLSKLDRSSISELENSTGEAKRKYLGRDSPIKRGTLQKQIEDFNFAINHEELHGVNSNAGSGPVIAKPVGGIGMFTPDRSKQVDKSDSTPQNIKTSKPLLTSRRI